MAVRDPRDLWRLGWRVAVSDATLAALLLLGALGLALAAWLPQLPSGDAVAIARQVSSLQARYGAALQPMRTLGLLSVTRSWAFQAVLALLASCLLLRVVEIADRLVDTASRSAPGQRPARERWFASEAVADWLVLVTHVAGLLVLAGLLISHLWGWARVGLVLQGEARVELPSPRSYVALEADGRVIHSPGVRIISAEWGPGALIRALDSAGERLLLQRGTDVERVPELAVPLVRDPDLDTRDALVAIPQANLIIRLLPGAAAAPVTDEDLLLQAYSSPSGELVTETTVRGQGDVLIGDMTLELKSLPYVQVSVARRPGAWLSTVGVLILLAGLLTQIAARPGTWPRRAASASEAGPNDSPAGSGKQRGL